MISKNINQITKRLEQINLKGITSLKDVHSSLNKKLGITKTGSRHLRTCLYMAALNGYRHNAFSNLKKRLEEKGKKPKVIVIAILHKLLRIVFGVITKGKAYMHENAH